MTDGDLGHAYAGFAKVRLVHRPDASVLLIDQLVVANDGQPYWLQPQWTSPPLLHFWDGGAVATLRMTSISIRGTTADVQLQFGSDDLVTSLPDRSQVYECAVRGPDGIRQHKSGTARLHEDGTFDLRLYHHTTESSKCAIQDSGEVWGSSWNFQGNKKLENCCYAYFTNLPTIRSEADLRRVAMASDGRLPLRLDQSPDAAPPDVVLDVYRGSTRDREHTVWLWVPTEQVAPSHVFLHQGTPVEYETAHPFIYRVGLQPGGVCQFSGSDVLVDQPGQRRFAYIVLGDCTAVDGLVAPYDEENTEQIFQVQDLGSQTIHEFWLAHGNQPLYTGDVELQDFTPYSGPNDKGRLLG